MHSAYSIQRDPRTFEFAAGMGMDGNHGNSTCTHQHLVSQRNSIYSTISTLHFQLLPCTWTLDATNTFVVLKHGISSKWLESVQSDSLPAGGPSSRPRSTQYVGRWWHHNSAVATVNSCSVLVPVQYQCSRLYRPADQSVIQTSFSSSDLYSNSFVPTFPTCPTYLCVCNVCGFWPLKGNYFQYASTLRCVFAYFFSCL